MLLGTPDWRTKFYRVHVARDLFGESQETVERDAPIAKMEAFIHARLAGVVEKAAKGLILKNSHFSPLYLLCFAAANKRGAPVALTIAQNILKD